ncbi:hypothetical protein HPP92_021113 [Vanilla planifolia]|uniref:Uncharacterized protein n=1 Tax=Vanilla planifolia TaxID=51239 RepID=A0A835UI81_VANPL|nr:hypothetical protein HPP92_021113 [Vanilla planifolia]
MGEVGMAGQRPSQFRVTVVQKRKLGSVAARSSPPTPSASHASTHLGQVQDIGGRVMWYTEKNVVAIAAGLVDVKDMGNNTKVGIRKRLTYESNSSNHEDWPARCVPYQAVVSSVRDSTFFEVVV